MLNDEKRGVEENYASAMTSSNLRVEADRPSDADVIIAAGWSQTRIGGALLRLHTEWDASDKGKPATFEDFMAGLNSGSAKERRMHAHTMAHQHNLDRMRKMLDDLKNSLPPVRLQVSLQLLRWRIEDAENKASRIIQWWLAQNCRVCHGTKFQVVQGTHRHNGKACVKCQGTGRSEIPHGQEGRRCANWMDTCVEMARASMIQRLRHYKTS